MGLTWQQAAIPLAVRFLSAQASPRFSRGALVQGVTAYEVINVLLARWAKTNSSGKTIATSPLFTAFVVLHNLLLCAYSAWTAVRVWSLFASALLQRGVVVTYNDSDAFLWRHGLDQLMWVFYLSKYWEFVDSWILIVKQKEVSTLQLFHHVGAVLSMWLLYHTRATDGA